MAGSSLHIRPNTARHHRATCKIAPIISGALQGTVLGPLVNKDANSVNQNQTAPTGAV